MRSELSLWTKILLRSKTDKKQERIGKRKTDGLLLKFGVLFSSPSETSSEDDSCCEETDTELQAGSIEEDTSNRTSSSAEDSVGLSVEDSEDYGVEKKPQ